MNHPFRWIQPVIATVLFVAAGPAASQEARRVTLDEALELFAQHNLDLRVGRAEAAEAAAVVVRTLKAGYARTLGPVLRHPVLVVVGAGALVVAALAVVPTLGRSFLPEFQEGTLVISAVSLPGTSLDESDALGRRIEEILLAHPAVVETARRTGRAELDEHAQGPTPRRSTSAWTWPGTITTPSSRSCV